MQGSFIIFINKLNNLNIIYNNYICQIIEKKELIINLNNELLFDECYNYFFNKNLVVTIIIKKNIDYLKKICNYDTIIIINDNHFCIPKFLYQQINNLYLNKLDSIILIPESIHFYNTDYIIKSKQDEEVIILTKNKIFNNTNKIITDKIITILNINYNSYELLDNKYDNLSIQIELITKLYNINFEEITNYTNKYEIDNTNTYFYCGDLNNKIINAKHFNKNFYQITFLENNIEIISNNYKLYKINNFDTYIDNILEIIKYPEYELLLKSYENSYKFTIICTIFVKHIDDFINTFNSLINQTFNDYEIIFINDYSDINFIHLFEKYNNITFINNKFNYGTYTSKNIGLKYVKGDIITFCDSDDLYDSKRLEYIYELFKNDIDYYIQEQNRKIVPITLTFKFELLDKIGYFRDVRFSSDIDFINRINMFSKKYYIDKNNYYIVQENINSLTNKIKLNSIERINYHYYHTFNKNIYFKPKYI